MRITQYAIGVLLIAALAGCTIAAQPVYQAGSPEEARWKKLEMVCIETGGAAYNWRWDGAYWECVRPDNAIKIQK